MKHKTEAIETGQTCPYCARKDCIESTSPTPDISNQEVFNNVVCVDCNKEWREVYTLTNVVKIGR